MTIVNYSESSTGASRKGKCPPCTSSGTHRCIILTSLRYCIAFAITVTLFSLLNGCSEKRHDLQIYAPKFKSELYGKLHLAEQKLGQKVNQPSLNVLSVQFEDGTTRSVCGWKGKRISLGGITGIEGGYYDQAGNMKLYLQDGNLWNGDWPCDPAVHEMAHYVLYTHGIPGHLHHGIMHQAGFITGDR